MRALIRPGPARGTVAAPPSKSMAHRLLIGAGLAGGTSVIHGVARSQDLLATADCLEALGAKVEWQGDDVRVTGGDPREAAPAKLDCRESGSTLRFLLPLCLLSGREMRLTGSEKLLQRPLSVYEEICKRQGIEYVRGDEALRVKGRLCPGAYEVPGDVSSQFVSGLLLALPLLEKNSAIRLLPPVESRPYIEMTMQALAGFGVETRWQDAETIDVPGGAAYKAREAVVEGDHSNAAFFEALNFLGGSVRVTGLNPNSLQGDRVCTEYFSRLQAGCPELDLADCPDLAPVLFAVAAALHGARFTGTRRLRFKESDRGAAMAEELQKFGVELRLEENEITVCPGKLHAPEAPLNSHNDHRVAMALSLLCTITGGTIEGAEAVRKSLPEYWDMLRSLGTEVEIYGMDQ